MNATPITQPQVTPQPSNWNGYAIAIIICIVVGALYYFISPHYETIVVYIETMKSFSEMVYTIVSALNSPDKNEPTQPKTQIEKETQKEQKESEKKITKTTHPKPNPTPDDSTSIIQGLGTSGYCYVGEWKGIRSCVKVDKTTPCKTQKYSTEELCVNPTLRP